MNSALDALRSKLEIERWLVARLGPGARPDGTFHGAGFDSLGTVALLAELSAWLGREVPPTLAWDHPTPARLAAHLAGAEGSSTGPAPAASAGDEPIAIVGLGCRFPGAASPAAFWQILCAGQDCTGPVPPERWATWQAASPTGVEPVSRGGFLDAVHGFDPAFFGISPREAHQIDPQQRLMLELTWEAFEDAGIDPTRWRSAPVGVFTGLVWRDYADLQSAVGAGQTLHTAVGNAGSIVANRVSYAFGFEGPSLAIDTACSSALVAVHTACDSLRRGESRLAVVGGVQLNLSPRTASAVNAFGALAPDGRCKTFSADADGYGRGEGAGVVLLEPLSAARRAGRTIYGVIRGSAVNNDGASNGITAPNPLAQRRLLEAAYARAGIAPGAAQYVELHGTGTPLGDPMEAGALGAVLGAGRPPARALRVGSVKTNIGHLEAAAGIAGLIKLALCLKHRQLPPSLHGERPNPRIDFDGWGLRLQRALEPWPEPAAVPVGGVSSFGFGGTNCHVVLTGLDPAPPEPPPVEAATDGGAPSVVFVFAGAGAPPTDVAALLHEEPAFRAAFERCDGIYRRIGGWSLIDAALQPGGAAYRRGRSQLPLNLAFGVSMAARWRSLGVEPAAVVGYSVGEWAAACVAGAITLEEAFRVAHAYTGAQRSVEAGRAAMGVVGLSAEAARARLAGRDGVWVSAENGPASAGIGGSPEAVAGAVEALTAEGVFARRVQIDFFAHIPPAAELARELEAALAGLRGRPTSVPFCSTVRGAVAPGEALDAGYWAANLAEPVRFGAAIEALRREGPRLWLDVDSHPIHGPSIAENLPEGERRTHLLESAINGQDPRVVLARTGARLRAWDLPVARRLRGPAPILISAHDPAALRARAAQLADVDAPVVDLAPALASRLAHHRHRLAITARDAEGLRAALAAFGRGASAGGVIEGEAADPPPVVFAFTGQGTQWAGMARDLLDGHPAFRAAFHDFAAAVLDAGGPALAPLLVEPPVDTAAVQPLVVAVQLGLVALLRDVGVEPAVVLGHSLGELGAACVAGALDVAQTARLVVLRGRAMAAPEGAGAMAAVDADPALLAELLVADPGPDDVVIAAHNGPRAHVLAGPPKALDAAQTALIARGAGVIRLDGDRAFHSPAMARPAAALREALGELKATPPALPIVSTTTGARHADFGAEHWAENVRRPVRFAEALDAALALAGPRPLVIEIGPHPALLRHIHGALEYRPGGAATATLRRGRSGARAVADLVGALYVAGVGLDFGRVFPEGAPPVALPPLPWQRQGFWFAHDAERLHPLLGGRPGRVDGGWRFEAAWSAERPALLTDHRYDGRIVVAGAVMVSAAIDGMRQVASGEAATVENVTFHHPLVIEDGEIRRCTLDRRPDGRFELASTGADGRRQPHADGTVSPGGAPRPAAVELEAIRARCPEELSGADFYDGLARTSLTLGPRFRWMARCWRGDGELLVRLRPVVAADGPAVFGLPPGVLDGCLQTLTLLAGGVVEGQTLMMLGIERLSLWAVPSGPSWCHLRRRSASAEQGLAIGDFTLYDADGAALMAVEGAAVVRAAVASISPRIGARLFGWRWQPAPGSAEAAFDGRWLVRAGPERGGRRLAEALTGAGADVTLDPGGDALPPGPWRAVIDLGSGDDPLETITDAMAAARAVMLAGAPPTVWITRGAVAADGGPLDAGQAARWAIAHTAAREVPEAGWSLIDVAPGVDDWSAVVAELGRSARAAAVALRDGARLLPKLAPLTPATAAEIRGRWLITGGSGALGRAVAGWLVERGAETVVLMGRAAPGPEAVALIERLRVAGAAVFAHLGDVADPAAVAAALALGADVPLRGVIHAAGVLADGVLTHQDETRAARALRPKLTGAEALAAAVADTPLDAFALFGSVAGALGSPGQGPYAAANAAMAAVVQRRRAAGQPAVLIEWGPWAGAGMAGQIRADGRSQDALALDGLDPELALTALGQMLAADEPRIVALSPTGSLAAFDRLGQPDPPPAPAPETPAPADDLPAAIADVLRAVLGLAPDDPLDPDRPLQELGLDSLMALEARKRLGAVVGRPLPATLIFDHPTVTALRAALAPESALTPTRRRSSSPSEGGQIALVGMACRLPGGVRDPDGLWRLLLDARDATSEVPPDRWDIDAWYDPDPEAPGKMITRRGGFIDEIDQFDAAFFGISAAEARSIDPQQRMLLELTWEALERAGLPPSRLAGRRVGVFLGLAVTEYGQLELHAPDPRGITPWSGQGAVLSMAAGRIAYVFGFEGPALTVDTACSSSLVAAHLATASLRRGECDLAVIAGANLMLTPRMTVYFSKMRALSPDGRCKSFDADADGYARGEGAGVIIAQRLEDARAEGQRVIACIRGSATNQDGRSVGVTAPRGPAQVGLIRDALADAGLTPDAVTYIEAHGTGTPLGDPIELGALARVFAGERAAPLAVGSLKSNVGHMEAAAGIGGLLKLALMVERGHLPRTLHVRRPTPRIDWETAPLRLVTEARPWHAPERIGGVNSFGFSGSNAHVVLGADAPQPAPPETLGDGPLILPLSARSPDALPALAEAVAARLEAGADWRAAVRTAVHRRDHLPHRLAVVAADGAEAAALLRAAHREGPTDARIARGHAPPGAAPTAPIGTSLADLARAWTTGAAIDWAAQVPPEGPWAALPTYPWQRRRYWPARAASLAPVYLDDADGRAPGEPDPLRLFGRRLPSPMPGWQFEALHGEGRHLDDHRPFGRRVVAGAQHILASLQAGYAVGLAGALERIDFIRPLALADGESAAAHTTFAPAADGGHTVRVQSLAPGSTDGWRDHMRADWRPDDRPPPLPAPLEQIDARCGEHIEAQPYVADPGLGPGFQCLTALRRGPEAIIGRVGAAGRPLDPGLLDSAFRALKALPGAGFAPETPLIPIAIRRVTMAADAMAHRGPVRLVGRQRPGTTVSRRTLESDLWLLDDQGRILMAFEGLTARAVDGDEMFVAGIDPTGLCLDQRWVTLPAARPAVGGRTFGLIPPADAPPAVSGLADALAAGLADAGHRVARCPAGADGARWLGDASGLDAVIDLQLLGADSRAAAASALMTAAAAARRDRGPRPIWLTRGAVIAGSSAAPGDAHGALLWGAMPTIGLEAPALGARVIDLPPGPIEPAELLAELLADREGEDRVALRDGRALGLRLGLTARARLGAEPAAVGGTWVITGGLGAVGLALAGHLVERGVEGLLLIGRSPPSPDADARIARWRAGGTPIRVEAVDVTDADALAACLAAARPTLPPIIGAVHAAGVRGDGALPELSRADIDRVLAPKVDGARALHHATADDPLRAFVLLGSVAGVLGNAGQVAYGAANGFLAALAAERRAAGRPAIALDFGPWSGGMADEATRTRLARLGADAFAPTEGAALISRLATLDRARLVVARIDWRRWASHHPGSARMLEPALAALSPPVDRAPPARPGAAALDRAALRALPPAEREATLRAWVSARIAALLELEAPPADETPLIELGFDSFFAVRLRNQLDAADLGIAIAPLLGEATLDSLVTHLLAEMDRDDDDDGPDDATEELEEFVF